MPESITTTRKRNLLLQLSEFTHKCVDDGSKTGAATAFAAKIGVHKSLLSKLKTERDISDALARQIEANLELPAGWMDESHEDAPLTSAESSLQELALSAYRATNAASRTALRKLLKSMAEGRDLETAIAALPQKQPPATDAR